MDASEEIGAYFALAHGMCDLFAENTTALTALIDHIGPGPDGEKFSPESLMVLIRDAHDFFAFMGSMAPGVIDGLMGRDGHGPTFGGVAVINIRRTRITPNEMSEDTPEETPEPA